MDLSEFHDVFFEECYEGLNVMESGLLKLDKGTDIEEINTIFRAAHSIKGGGASFGFMDISEFTHIMETLLDEMRDGRREVTRDGVDLLLMSVDILRIMVTAAQDKSEIDKTQVETARQNLEAMLAGSATGKTSPADVDAVDTTSALQANDSTNTAAGTTTWKIHFRPNAEILISGNEPARIFRELESMGELKVTADASGIPALDDIDPAQCYLCWELELKADVTRESIDELFSWVVDDSELEIVSLNEKAAEPEDRQGPCEADSVSEDPAETPAPESNVSKDKPAGKEPAQAGNGASKDSGSIRVNIDKVDELINLVGELVITQSMLSQTGEEFDSSITGHLEKLRDGLAQLERNTRELQESVLQIRMLPISFSFSRFPRLVRDLSSKMGKQVELTMTGENTEVDKTVLEKIGDPLVHLVRNSLDHGIEMPDIRKAAGKPETGTLELAAYHEGGDIIIKVIDDGAGLNKDRILKKAIEKGLVHEHEELSDERIYNLIFSPGFSTAEQLSEVSGRGVGMDVVRRNVRDLGGNVSIASNDGAGSTVTIRLPLTLAILDGQLARVGAETYIISLVSIIESLQMQPAHISSIAGQSELYRLRDEYIPIIRLNQLFEMNAGTTDLENGLLMIVESEGQRFGLFVDDLLGQQQVVIKSLETNFRQIKGISGATILGDGTVALIVDVPGLIQRHATNCNRRKAALTAVA
ncbi:MAG: chemotaxis protein CheA [Gammaproteobacteria bacterium]